MRLASRAQVTARVAAAVTLSALAGCGGGERRDAASGTYAVAIERASFPRQQHIGQRSSFVLRLRNAGSRTIPDVVVTLRGFSGRDGDVSRNRWIVDEPPAGTATAIEDTWAAGPLAPGATTTLRWAATPVVAGRHELRYAIAPGVAGSANARLPAGGEARGALGVHVTARPAKARVDPRSGAVIRD